MFGATGTVLGVEGWGRRVAEDRGPRESWRSGPGAARRRPGGRQSQVLRVWRAWEGAWVHAAKDTGPCAAHRARGSNVQQASRRHQRISRGRSCNRPRTHPRTPYFPLQEWQRLPMVNAPSRGNSLGTWKMATLVPSDPAEQLEFTTTNGATGSALKEDRPGAAPHYTCPFPGSFKLLKGMLRPFPRGAESRIMLVGGVPHTAERGVKRF